VQHLLWIVTMQHWSSVKFSVVLCIFATANTEVACPALLHKPDPSCALPCQLHSMSPRWLLKVAHCLPQPNCKSLTRPALCTCRLHSMLSLHQLSVILRWSVTSYACSIQVSALRTGSPTFAALFSTHPCNQPDKAPYNGCSCSNKITICTCHFPVADWDDLQLGASQTCG
jgi:hypothetical protein